MSNSIEVVAIGSELLAGHSINSNAAYLSRKLTEMGFPVQRHTVLPDDENILREGLSESLSCNSLVVATGGLGPTCDDLSKAIAAEIFESELRYDEDLAKDLVARYGNLETLQNQATVPTKAYLLKNKIGTAPGFLFSDRRGTLIVLPGVPSEMEAMFNSEVVPLLLKHFNLEEKQFSKVLHFGNLYEVTVDPYLREQKLQYPDVQFGIYPRNGLLTVQLTGYDLDQLESSFEEIQNKFRIHQFEAENGLIEEAIHDYFKKNHLTLSIAESCTGGSLSARIASLPGASQFFLEGIVSYSNSAKTAELKVPESLIQEKGAVSQEVAAAMADGIYALTKSNFSIAVTGIAGPEGGSEEKPVGTVFYAIKENNKPPIVYQLKAVGSRVMIIERAVNVILSELLFYFKI